MNGKLLDIETKGDAVMVNDAKVTATDIGASNGVIHVIDTVILPPKSYVMRLIEPCQTPQRR